MIPRNKIALSKAVTKFEKYVRELKNKFFEVFFKRVLDQKQADTLTQTVLEELGLPEVEEK